MAEIKRQINSVNLIMEKELFKNYDGTTIAGSNHDVYNTHIIELSRFLTTPLQIIRKYIPEQNGKRSSSCYHLLIVVYGNPRSTAGHIRSLLHSSNWVIAKKLKYLVSLGYINQIGKPRKIVPFQKFKTDIAYKITTKGWEVIKAVSTASNAI